MYSVGPATVALVDSSRGGMTMRAAKDLRDLISEILHNSGHEFAFWAEGEAARAAQVWRDSIARDVAREASGIHDEGCECDACVEAYDESAPPSVEDYDPDAMENAYLNQSDGDRG